VRVAERAHLAPVDARGLDRSAEERAQIEHQLGAGPPPAALITDDGQTRPPDSAVVELREAVLQLDDGHGSFGIAEALRAETRQAASGARERAHRRAPRRAGGRGEATARSGRVSA
jgi:hypothetical protein